MVDIGVDVLQHLGQFGQGGAVDLRVAIAAHAVAVLGVVDPDLGERGSHARLVLQGAVQVVKLPLDLEGTEPPGETAIGPEVHGGEGKGAVVAADVVAELDGLGGIRLVHGPQPRRRISNRREFDGTFRAADVVPRVGHRRVVPFLDPMQGSAVGTDVIHGSQVVVVDPTVILGPERERDSRSGGQQKTTGSELTLHGRSAVMDQEGSDDERPTKQSLHVAVGRPFTPTKTFRGRCRRQCGHWRRLSAVGASGTAASWGSRPDNWRHAWLDVAGDDVRAAMRGRRRHDGPAGDAKRRSAAIDGKGGLNPYTACIARRGRRSSRHPNEVGHREPSVTFRTLACIFVFVLVLDRGRSRGYRWSCGNVRVVLARNVSRGGSGREGSPGESSLHRARFSQVVLGSPRESGKDSRVRRSRTYSHGELGGSLMSEHILKKLSSRDGSRGAGGASIGGRVVEGSGAASNARAVAARCFLRS